VFIFSLLVIGRTFEENQDLTDGIVNLYPWYTLSFGPTVMREMKSPSPNVSAVMLPSIVPSHTMSPHLNKEKLFLTEFQSG
jgi:hypothetical protein